MLVLVLATAVGACSGDDPDIATVGDAVIRLSDVQSLYETNQPVDDAFRQALFIRIAVAAVDQALAAEYGTAVDPAAIESYYTQFQDLMVAQEATPAELLQVENASLRMIYLNAEISAARDTAMEALVVDPDIIEALFADPADVTTVCAKHILVATQEEATEVFARLQAGEDFAAVAAEVSLDTQAEGGDLGCNVAGDFVEPFAEAALAAPLGELYGPVETNYGFHVVVVSERTAATRAEYDADPWEVLSSTQASKIWQDWITAVVEAADVWIAEAYGTWAGNDILAPGEEVPTTTAGG